MSSTFTYLQTDFSSQKAALIQRVRSRFPGVWNDFYQGSFGSLYIDIAAWGLSTSAYTANRLAAENYVPTMQLRESAVRIGALVGYRLRGATPATVPCDAALSAPAAAAVTLSTGTPVRSADRAALTFELSQDYTIEAGETTPLRTAATFNPNLSGASNISALVLVTNGSVNVDCLDPAVDLRQLVQVGQIFRLAAGETEYNVASIEIAPGASSYNRLVLEDAWTETSASTTAEVIDRRIFFIQGQTQNEQAIAPELTAAYTYRLAYLGVIDGTVDVAVNGVAWTEVDDLVLAESTEQVYQVRTLPTGETIVAFGDGLFGEALPSAASLGFTYRTGGGTVGNIASGLITSSITGIVNSLASPVTVTVTNRQPGSGGLDPESLEEARARIPAFTRTNDRAVTLDDYQTLAVSFVSPAGQVRYARATVRTQNALLEGNVVVVYAWTSGVNGALVPLTSSLKTQLQQYLQSKAVGTDYVLIADGSATSFPLACRFKAVPGYDVGVVEDDVLAAVNTYVTALAPGAPALFSPLVTQLAAVPGVLAINVATPDQDVIPPTDSTVFSPPPARPTYALEVRSAGAGEYTAQAPAAPLTAWGLTASLNGDALNVTPDVTPGFARLTGDALSTDSVSTVNLQTGLVVFYTDGPVAEFRVGLISVSGYNHDRVVDLYVGYSGDTSQAKRREIRANLRVWAAGTPVGAPLFADQVPGAPRSVVSARAVVEAVDGITEVTRVSFDAPANTNPRVDVGEYELASVRNVYLNGSVD